MSFAVGPAQHRRAVAALVVASALWGLSFPFGKKALETQKALWPEASEWFHTALPLGWRFAFAVVLVLLFFGRRRIGRLELFHGSVLGGCCGLGLLFQMSGLQLIPASVSAFLTQLHCAVVPLLVGVDKRQWPRPRVWLALGVMLAGAVILSGFDPRYLSLGWGEALTLLGAVFFAGQVYWLERDDVRPADPTGLTVVMFAVLALLFLGLAAATAPAPAALWEPLAEPGIAVPVVGLAVFCTVGAFGLMIRWQPYVRATEAGIIYGAESVFAAVFALVLPGLLSAWLGGTYGNETLTTALLVGGTLIVGANVLLHLRPAVRPG